MDSGVRGLWQSEAGLKKGALGPERRRSPRSKQRGEV